jgi:hypothetical protein
MRLVLALLLLPIIALAQHKSVSYELMNEVGTYKLVSFTFSHELDNTEGMTYVYEKHGDHTHLAYQIDEFLNGWVALSNDGQTVAHLVSERDKEALERSELSMYRAGKLFDKVKLERLVSYELADAKTMNKLPQSGWLRDDSLYHQMASHAFYTTEDKLYLSFDKPLLSVFDLNKMFHIFSGNGANHFYQNYYSLPNPPFRTEMDGEEYFPKEFPKISNGNIFAQSLSNELKLEEAKPEEASFRVDVTVKMNTDGKFEIREAVIQDLKKKAKDNERSAQLVGWLENQELDRSTIPPQHPAWIFSQTFWLK